jgi:hypothetical protein
MALFLELVLTVNVAVTVIVGALLLHDLTLALCTGLTKTGAVVVFREAVVSAESSATVGTSEWNVYFLVACLAFHDYWRLFQT